jgi:Flp pilus assembly pilin Flp
MSPAAGVWRSAARGLVARLARQRGGASGLEYALLAAMIAAVIGVFAATLGLPIGPIFNTLQNGLSSG